MRHSAKGSDLAWVMQQLERVAGVVSEDAWFKIVTDLSTNVSSLSAKQIFALVVSAHVSKKDVSRMWGLDRSVMQYVGYKDRKTTWSEFQRKYRSIVKKGVKPDQAFKYAGGNTRSGSKGEEGDKNNKDKNNKENKNKNININKFGEEERQRGVLSDADQADTYDNRLAKFEEDIEKRQPPHWDREEEIWPFRLKAERSLRQLRLADAYTTLQKRLGREQTLKILRELVGFGYVYALNVAVAVSLISDPEQWWEWFVDAGGVADTEWEASNRFKLMSDWLKTQNQTEFDRLRYVEWGGLAGYKLPPYPGFDVVKETELLAHGGQMIHGGQFGGLRTFERIAKRTLIRSPNPLTVKMTFEEWLRTGVWATSGASSVGRVEWSDGDNIMTFKAKKNLVPVVMSMDELLSLCKDQREQRNKASVKPEPGKLRMMVVSDLVTYLKQAYLGYLINGAYLKWEGSTMQESVAHMTDRFRRSLDLLHKHFGLPFDFKAFDHQPTLDEIMIIVDCLIACASENVTPRIAQDFRWVCDDIKFGFRHAIMTVFDPESREWRNWSVEGGLMSGLFFTSVIGNAWNSVVTEWVGEVLEKLGLDRGEVLGVDIRGDDTNIVVNSVAAGILYRLGYDLIGAEGGIGKFGVHREESEFLRVWMNASDRTCRGYLSRSVSACTQSKPWNSSPWSPTATVEHIWDSLSTCLRRGADPTAVRDARELWIRRWCKLKKMDPRWLALPKSMGGLGVIGNWTGQTSEAAFPVYKRPVVKVTNMCEDWKLLVGGKFERLLPTRSEIDVLSELAASDMLSTDMVPGVRKGYREKLKHYWSAVKWKEGRTVSLGEIAKGVLHNYVYDADTLPPKLSTWGFSRWWRELDEWEMSKPLLRIRELDTMTELKTQHPGIVHDLRRLERKGFKRSQALDWLWGKVSLPPSLVLHSSLGQARNLEVAWCVVKAMSGRLRWKQDGELALFMDRCSQVVDSAINHSPVGNMFKW